MSEIPQTGNPPVCTSPAGAVEYLGAPCPSCGHTTIAHPGPSNPALVECILCRVQASVAEIRDRLEDLASAVGVPLEPWQLDAAALALVDAPDYDQVVTS